MDVIFVGISATMDFRELRMHNFAGKHPHVIGNVGCRYKISVGSILKSQKRQDVDAIVHDRAVEKHPQVQRKASYRYIGLKKSICESKYQGNADTSAVKRTSTTVNKPRI